jgi:hypothetical protein
MIVSRCTDCNHRDICKHKDEYDKLIRDIEVKVPDPFMLVLNCRHYYCTTSYLNTGMNSNWTTSYSNTISSPYAQGSHEVVY